MEPMEHITIDFEDNARVAKIKDSTGRIQFIVSLITLNPPQQITTPEVIEEKYLVKVKEITDLNVPQDIVREFFTKDEKQTAENTFKKLIDRYHTLVTCKETGENPPDVSAVFIDTVNYHQIDPDCCSNCAFALIQNYGGKGRKENQKIFCNCKKNLRQYEYTWDYFHPYYGGNIKTGDKTIPYTGNITTHFEEVPFYGRPTPVEVDFYGVCNNHCRLNNLADS